MLMTPPSLRSGTRRFIDSLSLQAAGVVITSIAVPFFVSYLFRQSVDVGFNGTRISVVASVVAALVALLIVRRVTSFPGTRSLAYIIPAFSGTFGLAIGTLLGLRLDYSSVLLFSAFIATTLFTFVIAQLSDRAGLAFYVLPFGGALDLVSSHDIDWIILQRPEVPANDLYTPIVADLHYDFAPEWERMLAAAAISGRAVYHSKQIGESLTGKVQIEHLSENSFGSLLPNTAYRKFKRIADIVAALVLIPVLVVPMLAVAVAVRLDSPGPALFRQRRMGYRGRVFEVVKFRTMKERGAPQCEESRIEDAITQSDDARITALGRFLRRSRIDELPQIWNVLRGEMSIIGPRPEAIPLSQWYERELPFYSYRHIVRPGITGWAQVTQGHVADLDSVHAKLHYDFYYIKNFSAWLDLLISIRTIQTVLTGFGSK